MRTILLTMGRLLANLNLYSQFRRLRRLGSGVTRAGFLRTRRVIFESLEDRFAPSLNGMILPVTSGVDALATVDWHSIDPPVLRQRQAETLAPLHLHTSETQYEWTSSATVDATWNSADDGHVAIDISTTGGAQVAVADWFFTFTTEDAVSLVVDYTVSGVNSHFLFEVDGGQAGYAIPGGASVVFKFPTAGTWTFGIRAWCDSNRDPPHSYSGVASFDWQIIPIDNEAPIITAPADITVPNDPRKAGAVVHFNATATDNLEGSVPVICSDVSGFFFPIATTTVSCTATDSSGNMGTAQFDVTVLDKEQPIIIVPVNVTVPNDPSKSGAIVYFNPTATDNFENSVVVTCSPPSGTLFPFGTATVTCAATDSSGNTATASFNVTVIEQVDPGADLEAILSVSIVAIDSDGKVLNDILPGQVSGKTVVVHSTTGKTPQSAEFRCPLTCVNSYPMGTEVLLSANARPGWTFDRWEGIDEFGTEWALVTMNEDNNVIAVFREDPPSDDFRVEPFPEPVPAPSPQPLPTPFPQFVIWSPLTGVQNVTVELSRDAGRTFEALWQSTANDGSEQWIATGPSSSRAIIRVSDAIDPSNSVTSEEFVICDDYNIDGACNENENRSIPDMHPPTFLEVANPIVEAVASEGTVVWYTDPVVVDDRDSHPYVTCDPARGSNFPVGATIVTCGAIDETGNVSEPITFEILIQDTTAPWFREVLENIVAETPFSNGLQIAFPYPMAEDSVDSEPSVTCLPHSGAIFPLGAQTVVNCTAIDDWGNTSALSFAIDVQLDRDPFLNPLNRRDVDADGIVSPIDVHVIINDLNDAGSRPLPTPPFQTELTFPFLDTDGDNHISPLDALIVINYLNSFGTAEGELFPALLDSSDSWFQEVNSSKAANSGLSTGIDGKKVCSFAAQRPITPNISWCVDAPLVCGPEFESTLDQITDGITSELQRVFPDDIDFWN